MSEMKQGSKRKPSTSRNAKRQSRGGASRSRPKGGSGRTSSAQNNEKDVSIKPPRVVARRKTRPESTPVALKQSVIPVYKTSKVDELAAKYERLLQTAWDPVPGVRLVINGEEIMKEMLRVTREETPDKKAASDSRAFYKSFLYKERFPMLCNYLSLWVKRRGGQTRSEKTMKVSSTQDIFKGSDALDSIDIEEMSRVKKRAIEVRENGRATHSTPHELRRPTSPPSSRPVAKGSFKLHQNENVGQKDAAAAGSPMPSKTANDSTDDSVLLRTERRIEGHNVKLSVVDADSSIGIVATLEGYQEGSLHVPEEQMLIELLRNGVKEDDLATMDMPQLCNNLLSIVKIAIDQSSREISVGLQAKEETAGGGGPAAGQSKTAAKEVTAVDIMNVQTVHAKSLTSLSVVDGGGVVTASMDKSAHLWNFPGAGSEDLESSRLLLGHSDAVTCVSSTGKWVCTGSRDGTIMAWSMEEPSGEPIVLEGHGDVVRDLSAYFHVKGNAAQKIQIVSASRDKTLKVWDVEGETCLKTLKGHNKPVASLTTVFRHNDKTCIASGSTDKTVCVWSTEEDKPTRVFEGHTKAVTCVDSAVLSGKRVVLSGSSDKTVRVWSLESGACVKIVEGFSKALTQIVCPTLVGAGGNACFALTLDGKIALYNINNYSRIAEDLIGKQERGLMGGTARCMAVGGEQSMLFVGGQKGHVTSFQIAVGNDLLASGLPVANTNATAAISRGSIITWDDSIDIQSPRQGETAGPSGYSRLSESMLGQLKGSTVSVFNTKKKLWNPAVVWRENPCGSFDLCTKKDGDRKIDIPPARIMVHDDVAKGTKKGRYGHQQAAPPYSGRVLSRYKGGWQYYSGVVGKASTGSQYDVLYDDGESETGVPSAYLKHHQDTFSVGDTVEAKYKGGKKWYLGSIVGLGKNGANKFDVKYLDGEVETGCKRKYVWFVSKRGDYAPAVFEAGDQVLARHGRGSRKFPGTVEKVRLAGKEGAEHLYDIKYDDGDVETKVESWLISKKTMM